MEEKKQLSFSPDGKPKHKEKDALLDLLGLMQM